MAIEKITTTKITSGIEIDGKLFALNMKVKNLPEVMRAQKKAESMDKDDPDTMVEIVKLMGSFFDNAEDGTSIVDIIENLNIVDLENVAGAMGRLLGGKNEDTTD